MLTHSTLFMRQCPITSYKFSRETLNRHGPHIVLAGNDDPRLASAEPLNHIIEMPRILRMQPDAAMGCRAPQPLQVIGAVDGVSAMKKDRMRHRRIIIFAGAMKTAQKCGPIAACGCPVAAPPGRNRPNITKIAMHINAHLLLRYVYPRQHARMCRRRKSEKQNYCRIKQPNLPHLKLPLSRSPRNLTVLLNSKPSGSASADTSFG